jgi:hypothetical protein
VENLHGDLSLDGANVGAGIRRPGSARVRRLRSLIQPELAQDLFVRNALAAKQ